MLHLLLDGDGDGDAAPVKQLSYSYPLCLTLSICRYRSRSHLYFTWHMCWRTCQLSVDTFASVSFFHFPLSLFFPFYFYGFAYANILCRFMSTFLATCAAPAAPAAVAAVAAGCAGCAAAAGSFGQPPTQSAKPGKQQLPRALIELV